MDNTLVPTAAKVCDRTGRKEVRQDHMMKRNPVTDSKLPAYLTFWIGCQYH